MDPSHLTQKSQEALHSAQAKVLRYGRFAVQPILVDRDRGITRTGDVVLAGMAECGPVRT
jgi:hypothetical protein